MPTILASPYRPHPPSRNTRRGDNGGSKTAGIATVTTPSKEAATIIYVPVRGRFRLVVGLSTTTTTEPASGRTVAGKKGREGSKKTPMSRTLTSRPIGRESISPHPTPYIDTEAESATKTMVGLVATIPASLPDSKREP